MILNLPAGVDAYVHTLIGAVIVIVTTNAKEINSIAVNLMIFWPLSNRTCHSSRGGWPHYSRTIAWINLRCSHSVMHTATVTTKINRLLHEKTASVNHSIYVEMAPCTMMFFKKNQRQIRASGRMGLQEDCWRMQSNLFMCFMTHLPCLVCRSESLNCGSSLLF